ncbi:MAG TPA: 3'-5' exonuclease [Bacteroidetes bacterium]|nr:3'-5' exonuclease [Bacteroidota bacterium]
MPDKVPIQQILFLDIETVPMTEKFDEMPGNFRKLWICKANKLCGEEGESAEDKFERAGIYAEFGKVVCISVGMFHQKEGKWHFRLKSFFGEDEKEVLKEFIALLNGMRDKNPYLCAHNGKEFDFPYLARRIIINRLKLPALLEVAGKKPWEVPFLDTMELWKFGDYKHYTSLELLSAVFDIPTSKDDIDGSQVAKVYYKEKDLKRIAVYCEKDVLTTARVYQRYLGLEPVSDEKVVSATDLQKKE